MEFYTDYRYTSRQNKPYYVYEKYKSILNGKILDVGADKGGLRTFLPKSDYVCIDIEGPVDLKIDLEKENIPFKDGTFDCVLCLDVLEHLDNIHEVFDECCRLTKGYFILSLPNPWASFMGMLIGGYYKEDFPMKFYNLPVNHPIDRHKWFYGLDEAKKFIEGRGMQNNMEIIQLDIAKSPITSLKMKLFIKGLKLVLNENVDVDDLFSGNIWAVLKKK